MAVTSVIQFVAIGVGPLCGILAIIFILKMCRKHRRTLMRLEELRAQEEKAAMAGLPPTVIASLETWAYAPAAGADAEGRRGILADATSCSICMQGYEAGEALRVLPCRHAFHAAGCVDRWLAAHPTCPYCGANVRRLLAAAGGELARLLLLAAAGSPSTPTDPSAAPAPPPQPPQPRQTPSLAWGLEGGRTPDPRGSPRPQPSVPLPIHSLQNWA